MLAAARAHGGKRCKIFRVELHTRRREAAFDASDLRCPGNRHDVRTLRQQPRERYHVDGRRVLLRDALDNRILLEAAVAEVSTDGGVGNEGDSERAAALDEPRVEVARVEHVA